MCISVEGMSLQAWMEEGAVSRVLGPNTVIDYFDIATLQKEDTTVLSRWAWTADPSAIPKAQWVTVSGAPAASSTIELTGLQKRVIIHLDLHEDFTPSRDGVVLHQPHYSYRFRWVLGEIDGERKMTERTKTPARRTDDHDRHRREDDRSRRRDDEDDDDRRGRRDDRSWAQRIFRSRSRPADKRGDNRRDDRRDYRREDRYRYRERDDHSGHDGGRCRASTVSASLVHGCDDGHRRRSPLADRGRGCSLRRSASRPMGRGRSPPASPAARALFLAEEVILPRVTPTLISWITSPCCTPKVLPDFDNFGPLPPPPPLPLEGPMPRRLFSPLRQPEAMPAPSSPALPVTILRRPAATHTRSEAQMPTTQVHDAESLLARRPVLRLGSITTDLPMQKMPEKQAPAPASLTLSHCKSTSPPTPETPVHATASPMRSHGRTPSPPLPDCSSPARHHRTPSPVELVLMETPAPDSTPPRPPKNRRKTLAGVTGFAGFPMPRASPRLKAKKRQMPIAQLAERLLSRQ